MNVRKEIRRLIREALRVQGGTGGRRVCRYCGRESFKGQTEHYRVGVKSQDHGCDMETHEHCAVTVFKEVLKALDAAGAPSAAPEPEQK